MISIGMGFMGGKEGCGSVGVISYNLCNSSHYDHDDSYSISLFVKKNLEMPKGGILNFPIF